MITYKNHPLPTVFNHMWEKISMAFEPKSREGKEMMRAFGDYSKSVSINEAIYSDLSVLEELAMKLKDGYRVANHFLKETHGLSVPENYVKSLLPICHSIEGYESIISSEMNAARRYGLGQGYLHSLVPIHEKHNFDEISLISSRYDVFLDDPTLIEDFNKSVSSLSGSIMMEDIIAFLPKAIKCGVRDSDFSSLMKSLRSAKKSSAIPKELELMSSDPFYFGNIITAENDADINGIFIPIVGAFGSGGTFKSSHQKITEATIKTKDGGTITLNGGKIYLDDVVFDPSLLKSSFDSIDSYVALWRRGSEVLRGINYYFLPAESRFSFGNVSYEISYVSAAKNIDRIKVKIGSGPEVSGLKDDIEFLKKIKGGVLSFPIKYKKEDDVFIIDVSAKPDILGHVSGMVLRKATKRADVLEAIEFLNSNVDGDFIGILDYESLDVCEFAHYFGNAFEGYFESLGADARLTAARAVFLINDDKKIGWLRDKYPSIVKKIKP